MGDLDETDDIKNNMDGSSWLKGAPFHVKMFIKYERLRLEHRVFPQVSACNFFRSFF